MQPGAAAERVRLSPASRTSIPTSSGCTTSRTRISVQHELLPGVSVTGGWYHRDYHNLRRRDNTLQSFADYTPFTLYSPIDGTPITYYNVSAAPREIASTTWTAPPATIGRCGSTASSTTSTPGCRSGITIFGGGMSERTIAQICDEKWNPNLLLYCDQTKSGIPFRTQFKIAGTVPMVYGIQVGLSFQSLPGYRLGTARCRRATASSGPTGQPSAAQLRHAERRRHGVAHHADDDATACRAIRASPGQVRGRPAGRSGHDRGVAVGAAHRAEHRVRRPHQPARLQRQQDVQGEAAISIQPKFDFFNAVERFAGLCGADARMNYGTASYKQPQSILVGRVFQLGGVVRF